MSRKSTMEIYQLNGDENQVPQHTKPKLNIDQRRETRNFGRDIINLITHNYPSVVPQLPPKAEKIQARPASLQRNLNNRPHRANHSQDERVNRSECQGYSPIIPNKSSCDGEIELDKIDREDSLKDNRGSLVAPYVKEIFHYLRDKEQAQPNTANYMQNQTELNCKMRVILVDWLVDVHARFNLQPETLFLCISLIDRYLDQCQLTRNKLQLLGISTLFVSAKYCEIYPPALNYFSEVTDRTYSKQEILDMESKIILALEFDLGRCTQLGFYERYSKISKLDEKIYNLGRYTIELALLDNRFNKYIPSMIASAALYLSLKIFKSKICWPSVVEFQSGYTESMVRSCAKDLCTQLQQAHQMSQQAIQRKFSSKKYMEISKIQIETKQNQQKQQIQ